MKVIRNPKKGLGRKAPDQSAPRPRIGTVTQLEVRSEETAPYYLVYDETGETHAIRSGSMENGLTTVFTGMRVRLTWVRTASGAWWVVTDATKKAVTP